MTDDRNNNPSPAQNGGSSGCSGRLPLSGGGSSPNQAPPSSQAPVPLSTMPLRTRGSLWVGMTPDERAAYAKGTRKRRSRVKPRPSLDKHADLLKDCVRDKAVMAQVFDDLVILDPAVLAEFSPKGHRAFNAHVKRKFA